MCGIVGIYNYRNKEPVDRILLKKSTDLIAHRGPDGEGFYFDDPAGIGFGHRRLSIIDLETGDQPMCNEDGTLWITFNGEIYNYRELRSELLQHGHVFKTNSDTEVIIHAYEEYGYTCVERFNGIFAFALWDSKDRELYLARDHFGVKPLYYYDDGSRFIFGSEIKAILPWIKENKCLNEEALALCLTFRHTPAPLTLFKNIYKIPTAHYLKKEYDKEHVILSYWNIPIEIDSRSSENEWIELLSEKFERAVKRQMIADVPIGISLSGGVDSGSILSIMSKNSSHPVHAFTVGFKGGKLKDDEIKLAESTAKRFGAEFTSKIICEEEYLSFFDKYKWHLEEPIGNESAVAYYFVAEMAKNKVKVLLNGQGADEPFAGYDRYIGMYYADKYSPLSRIIVRTLALLPHNLNRKFQFLHLNKYIQLKDTISKIALASSILSMDMRKKVFGKELKLLDTELIDEREVNRILQKFPNGTPVERILIYDMFTSLSENLLLCGDKMAMAASIEARVPFLDVELIATALSIPAHFKIRGTSGKYIYKKMCEKYLPKPIVYQRKIGFTNPMESWLKKSLGLQLVDLINSKDSITNRYLNKTEVMKMYELHLHGKSVYSRFLYLLFSIEMWKNLFLP